MGSIGIEQQQKRRNKTNNKKNDGVLHAVSSQQ
jgi:hypothetical protein